MWVGVRDRFPSSCIPIQVAFQTKLSFPLTWLSCSYTMWEPCWTHGEIQFSASFHRNYLSCCNSTKYNGERTQDPELCDRSWPVLSCGGERRLHYNPALFLSDLEAQLCCQRSEHRFCVVMTTTAFNLEEMFSMLVSSLIHNMNECDEQHLYILFSKKFHFWFRKVFFWRGWILDTQASVFLCEVHDLPLCYSSDSLLLNVPAL